MLYRGAVVNERWPLLIVQGTCGTREAGFKHSKIQEQAPRMKGTMTAGVLPIDIGRQDADQGALNSTSAADSCKTRRRRMRASTLRRIISALAQAPLHEPLAALETG